MRRAALLVLAAVAGCAPSPGPGPSPTGGSSGTARPPTTTTTSAGPSLPGAPVAGHPRLWLREEDLPRLRAWARPTNPRFVDGLGRLADIAKKDMDDGKVLGTRDCANGPSFCESYAALFAFLSLVHPEATERADYAARGRKVLVHALERAASGKAGDPLAGKTFSVRDRARWAGESFPLAVDWLYPHLSAEDKALARKVFLRWVEENLAATTTSHNHPEPIGALETEALVKDPRKRRYALNNYFASHTRNIGLMAMALDAADDPEEAAVRYRSLRGYLKNATGAWLYMVDAALRKDAAGGLAPEGMQYGPSMLGGLAMLHLALATAGEANASRHGAQAVLAESPFWGEVLPALLHRVARRRSGGWDVAFAGDGERYGVPDFIDVVGPLGLLAGMRGDAATVSAARWIETHLPPGGPTELTARARARNGGLTFRHGILYFMLFDPDAPPSPDPREKLPLSHFAAGLGDLSARTSFGDDASWLSFRLGWAQIDHQHGDGNGFSFFRKGEWLTKDRVGYGHWFATSAQHNTVAVENDRPNRNDPVRKALHETGSQWILQHDADGAIVARSEGPGFVAVTGDATGLYNASAVGARGVEHASRSLVWLPPDHLVVYDRVATAKDGRFRRFFLQTPGVSTVSGNQATVATQRQRLHVTTVLPVGAKLAAEAYVPGSSWETKPANDEPMTGTLRVEPAKPERETRFLHVLEATDGAPAQTALHVKAEGGAFEGAAFSKRVVLFPVTLEAPPAKLEYVAPAGSRHLVVGLERSTGYSTAIAAGKAMVKVTIAKGGAAKTDSAGVLGFGE